MEIKCENSSTSLCNRLWWSVKAKFMFYFFPVVSVPHYYSRGRVLSNPLLGGDGFITYHSALKSEAPILGDQVFSLQFIQFCFVAGQYDMSELWHRGTVGTFIIHPPRLRATCEQTSVIHRTVGQRLKMCNFCAVLLSGLRWDSSTICCPGLEDMSLWTLWQTSICQDIVIFFFNFYI